MFRFLQVVAFVATVDDVPEQVQAQQVSLFGSGLECTGYTALSRVYSLPSCQTGPWETLLGPYQDMNIVYTQIPTWRGKQIYVRLSVGNRRATLAVSRFTAYNIICSSDIYSLRPISIWGLDLEPLFTLIVIFTSFCFLPHTRWQIKWIQAQSCQLTLTLACHTHRYSCERGAIRVNK
jgi:hypothetical protein